MSGGGKTTLIKLLLKLYEPNEGSIKIGKYNIADLEPQSIRRRIGYVPQNVSLFSGTIAENICMHNPGSTLEEIIDVCEKTGANKFIEQLPGKYNTMLGERGINLSGGERQRLALSRALMGDPDILIFDEATSNLDSISELLITETINSLSKDKTVIMIAHRLSTIAGCDRIFVMANGHIVQEGTHKQLMEQEGLYKQLTVKMSL